MDTAKISKGTVTKRLFKVLVSVVLAIVLLATVGLLVTQYLPQADMQAWFQRTRWLWFGVRIVLYVAILALMQVISRKKPEAMPKTAKWLMCGILVFAEAISQITLV